MTTTIRMDMDRMQELNRSLAEMVMTIMTQGGELAKSINVLDSAWSGDYAEGYVNNLRVWLGQCGAIGKELEALGGKVSREMFEWEMVDSQKPFGSGHDEVMFLPAGAAAALLAGGTAAGGMEVSMLEKGLAWVPSDTVQMGLEIYQRGREDWEKYQDPSDRMAAIAIDSAFVIGKTAAKAVIKQTVSGSVSAVLLCTPAAPLAVPLGMLAGAVSGYAFDWVADEAWGWLEDKGIKDAMVHAGGAVIDWGADKLQDGWNAIKDFGSGTGSFIKSGWDYVFG